METNAGRKPLSTSFALCAGFGCRRRHRRWQNRCDIDGAEVSGFVETELTICGAINENKNKRKKISPPAGFLCNCYLEVCFCFWCFKGKELLHRRGRKPGCLVSSGKSVALLLASFASWLSHPSYAGSFTVSALLFVGFARNQTKALAVCWWRSFALAFHCKRLPLPFRSLKRADKTKVGYVDCQASLGTFEDCLDARGFFFFPFQQRSFFHSPGLWFSCPTHAKKAQEKNCCDPPTNFICGCPSLVRSSSAFYSQHANITAISTILAQCASFSDTALVRLLDRHRTFFCFLWFFSCLFLLFFCYCLSFACNLI